MLGSHWATNGKGSQPRHTAAELQHKWRRKHMHHSLAKYIGNRPSTKNKKCCQRKKNMFILDGMTETVITGSQFKAE